MSTAKINRSKNSLQTSDFTLSANQSNYESEVATYVVPQNRVVEIPDDFMGLKLMTRDSFSFTASNTSQAITTAYNIVQDPNLNNASGGIGIGTNVVVYIEGSGVSTSFSVTLPNTVTLTGLTSGSSYSGFIYYLFGNGQAKLTVTSSDGTATTTVLTRNIANLNQLNQNDTNVGLKPGMVNLVIPDRFKIQLKVTTSAPVFLYASGSDTAYSSQYAVNSFIDIPILVSSIFEWPGGRQGALQYAKQQYMSVTA